MTKITLILILSLLFSSLVYSQEYSDKLRDTIYNSDTLVVRTFKINGKIDTKEYYIQDTLSSYTFYVYNKDHYYTSSHSVGKKAKINFNQGFVKEFYLDGKPKAEYHTNRRSATEGNYKTYYKNGNPECDCQHVNGLREGIQNHHYENGQTKSLGNYKNDKREGKTSFYYENGQLKKEVMFKNGIPWETLSHYDANGNPIEKGTLKNGNGTYYIYDDKGKLENIELYKNGKLKKKNYSPKSTDS